MNYGILNDPSLTAAIAPAPKAAGGTAWMNGVYINATANEIFNDAQSMVIQAINQSNGQLNTKSDFIMAMSPAREGAMTAVNTFNVAVADLLIKAFPGLKVKTAVQYGALTASNPQGNAVGEVVQLYAPKAEGQNTGFCAFNTKLRAGTIIREMSSFKQKFSQGSAGFVLRQPYAVVTMVGA
jgi:hypothetical protein